MSVDIFLSGQGFSCLVDVCRLVVFMVGSGQYLSALGAFRILDTGCIANICRHVVHPYVWKPEPYNILVTR